MSTRASLFVIVLCGGALFFAVEERARLSGGELDNGLYQFEAKGNCVHDNGYFDDRKSPGSEDPCQHVSISPLVGVDDWHWKSDAELKQAVECQLAMSSFIQGDGIDVSVSDGTATLRGHVGDWDSVKSAIGDAFQAGVKDVVSELEVVDHV